MAAPAARSAVLYSRVSSKDQEREGYSIPAQQALLQQYARDRGFRILEEFVDVETAKRAGRTSFGEMLAFLRKRKTCKVILVEKTDRLYRNLKDWVTLDAMELEIHLVKEGVVLSEGSRSTDKFMHGIRVLMAKNYIDNLSEEVKKGMRQKAEEGHWPNPAPLGYLNRREGGKSLIVPDAVRAPLVRQLFEQYDGGNKSIADLAEWSGRVGLTGKQGGSLTPSTVHWILRNPVYAGKFIWDGAIYESKDPTLVSWDLFERVQERLDGHPYTRASDHDMPFTGLVTCGRCGSAITVEVKKQGRYVYYRCAKACMKGEKYVSQARLVELFGEHLRRLHMPDAWMALAVHALRQSRQDIRADIEARVAAARARYDRAGRLIDKAYEDKLEGRVEDEFFFRKRSEWEADRAAALHELERMSSVDRADVDLGVAVLELGKQAYDRYIRLEPAQQRALLDLVFLNSKLTGGQLEVTWREPFSFLANLAEATPKENAPPGVPDGAHPEWWAILDLNQ
ncbi:recombinase family protein [Myxococcota bacterium]|nr:recombinase family protein [Myxococcota bacterium]